MARPYITLKIQNTADGDSVTFYADGRYLQFTCSAIDIQLFEYKANPTPGSNNGAIFFSDDVGQSLSSDYELIRNQQVVTVRSIQDGNDRFNFGVVSVDNSSGSLLSVIDQGNADGTIGIVVTDDRVTPIQTNSVEHNVVEFYPVPNNKDFPYGNAGDTAQTIINFTTFKSGSVGRFDFRYGYISNDVTPISNDPQTNTPYIPDVYFSNFETTNTQSFSIDSATGVVSLSNPKNWQKDEITLNDIGGGVFEIVHTHKLPGFARSSDVSGDTLEYPQSFEGGSSLKYVFEITSKTDNISTSNLENSTIGNAQSFFKNGNIGYYNEFLNGGTQKYTKESFSWDNTENELDYTQNTKGLLQIKNNVGGFSAASEVVIKIQEINAIDNESLTLLENINEDRVKVLADGVGDNSINILNAVATLNADPTLIDVEFEVVKYQYISNYALSVSVSNDTAINHENILIEVDSASAGVDTSDWVLSAYAGSLIDTISLNPHYDMSIGSAFNNMVGSVEDRVLARWTFEDQSTDKEITKLKAEVKSRDGSQVFDTYEVTPSQIDANGGSIDTTKGYKLAVGDTRNSLKVVKTGSVYSFDYAFQFWENMTQVDDLVFSFTVNGNQTLETGEVFNADKDWRTAILGYSINSNPTDYTNTLGYDLSRNDGTQGDPKYIFESDDYIDLASGTVLDSLGKSGVTKIDVSFAPEPSILSSPPDINDIVGYFGIRPCGNNQLELSQFTTYSSPEIGSPFEDWDDSGNTTFLDKTFGTGQNINLRANINYDKLKLIYPDADQFELSFRLDKVQSFTPPINYVISGNSRIAGVDNINFDTVSLAFGEVVADLTVLDDTEFDYDIDGVPSADVTSFEGDLSGIAGTQNARLTPNTTSYIDSGAIVKYGIVGGSPIASQISFDFLHDEPMRDVVYWFEDEIQFSSASVNINLINVGLSIRVGDPSTEDWTVFSYSDINTDLALINSEITAQYGTFGKYAVHLTAFPKGTVTTSITMPFDYVTPDLYQSQLLTWKDIIATHDYNNCVEFEANGALSQIQYNDAALLNLFDYSLMQPFSVTLQYRNNNSTTAGNARLFQGTTSQGANFEIENGAGWRFEIRSDITERINIRITSTELQNGNEYSLITVTYDGSQSQNGLDIYIDGIKREDAQKNAQGVIGSTVPPAYFSGQALVNIGTFKFRRLSFHDRVITPEEIRHMTNDLDFIPSSGLLRSYNMKQTSPTYPGSPEYIYEETNDAVNSPNVVLSNHTNNRVSF